MFLDHLVADLQINTKYGIVTRMEWSVETLNTTVDRELGALPSDMRARFSRIVELIEAVGLPHVSGPHVGHIHGPLWEMRLKGQAGIARALYVAANDRRVVVLRVFIKKTQKTPDREIRLALERAKGIEPMTKAKDLHRKWMKEPGYRADYEALGEEFALAQTLIEARTRAGLSQTQLAQRMKTSQSYVARIESGRVHPSTGALERFAHATGTRLKITFEPARSR